LEGIESEYQQNICRRMCSYIAGKREEDKGIKETELTKQNSYMHTNIKQEPHTNQSHQQTSDIEGLKNMMKSLFEEMETILNLLTTVLTKLQ
jgi:hypothetical protein